MFSSCFCIFNECNFGIFSSEGDLWDLWFGMGGYLLISYSLFLSDFAGRVRASHLFTLKAHTHSL